MRALVVGFGALALFVAAVNCFPTAGMPVPNSPENVERLAHLGEDELAEEFSGQFEGDMVLNEEQEASLRKRNGLIAQTRHWPNRIVTYYIHEPDFTPEQVQHIELGVRILESQSCLQFRRVNPEDTPAYIRVIGSDSGCYSSVGYTGRAQNLNLQPNTVGSGCFRIGTVVHEFLHALGFYHQQSASDRDEFVDIIWENIQAGTENNFNIYAANVVTDFNVRYDYGSVMHYSATAFSVNGQRTIVPKDPNASIGQRLSLSERDISKLNWMYGCLGKV